MRPNESGPAPAGSAAGLPAVTLLPVVQRELTVAGRHRWTYAVRCVAAGLLALITGLLLGLVGDKGPAGLPLPRLIFNLLSAVAFAGALLGGLLLTIDAITSERRDDTLGLLFLTEWTGIDIVPGKLVSCGIQGLCALGWVLGLTFAGTGLALALAFLLPTQSQAAPCFLTALFSAYACHVLFKRRTTLISSGPLVEDAAGGGLELLLGTPLPPPEILAGHAQAVRKATNLHLGALVLLNLALTAALTDDQLGLGTASPLFLVLFLGGIVPLWADRDCLTGRGARQALRTPRLNHALARTLVPVLVQPWLAALAVFLGATHGMSQETALTLFLLAQAAQVLAAVILTRRAQKGLEHHFLRRAGRHGPVAPTVPSPVPGSAGPA